MDSLRRFILPCLLVGLITAFVLQVRPFSPAKPYHLRVSLHSDTAGRARLIWQSQKNAFPIYPADWDDVSVGEQVLSFNLPDTDRDTFKRHIVPKDAMIAFRLDPLDREGRVTIRSIALVGPQNETVAAFPPSTFIPMNKESPFQVDGESVTLTCRSEEGIFIAPKQPIPLTRITVPIRPASAALEFGGAALATLSVLALAGCVPAGVRARLAARLAKMRDAQAAWPVATLLAAAVLATAASCYPVIFFGKTFVSPNFGPTPALYNEWPSIPQGAHEVLEPSRGTDTGAIMWAHLPYSIVEHRAIFEHGELPLWNRYVLCGSPLLGQGQNMLGDPLHWIAMAARGAVWVWDVKFCIAKLLFSFGVGLLVFHATQRLWLAALLAISSSFIGYFSFRFNHCAYFSLCYAPWMLLCWLRAARTQGRVWPWALALAAANFWELSSGTAKEAAILILGLNFTGGLLVLTADETWRSRLAKLALMNFGNLLFVMLSAPHWMLFLDALSQSFTYLGSSHAFQIQPSLVLGLFDELFYSQIARNEPLFNPGANFLLLVGCLWAAVDLRRLLSNRVFLAVLLGAAIPAAIVFGVIPPELLTRLPFIKSIQHVDDVFSTLLIVHLPLIAAFGLRALWDNAMEERAPRDAVIAAILLALLAALYFGYTHAVMHHGTDYAPLRISDWSAKMSATTVRMSGFFRGYATALLAAALALPWVVRHLRRKPSACSVIAGGLCLFLFHFRHGLWTGTKFDDYVSNPRTRSDLAAPSPAVAAIRAALDRDGEPARVIGLTSVLVAGFNIVPGLEHVGGPDALANRWQRDLAEKCGFGPAMDWMWWPLRDRFPAARAFGDLWNIRWYLGNPRDVPRDVSGLTLLSTLDLATYVSPTAWPRAFFTDRLAECSSLDDFVSLLRAGDGRPFAALVPEKPSGTTPASAKSLAGRTVVAGSEYHLTENSVSFTINAPTPGVAVLGNSFEKGNWRVTLDGRAVDCFRVNHAFLGVALPEAGVHKLRFKYWPRLLTPALWLALAGLVGVALTLLAGIRNKRQISSAA